MEVYLYFDMPKDALVMHYMGEPNARAFMNEKEFEKFHSPIVRKSIPFNPYDKHLEDFSEKNREFYTAWTRRESYTKRIGSDIFDNLKDARIEGEYYRDGIISSCGERY